MMKYRFNSPPGWPQPPQGWKPNPTWKPDPSWPPAPENWNFWIDKNAPELVVVADAGFPPTQNSFSSNSLIQEEQTHNTDFTGSPIRAVSQSDIPTSSVLPVKSVPPISPVVPMSSSYQGEK